MKHISEIKPDLTPAEHKQFESGDIEINEKAKKVIDQIFKQLASIFPAWRSTWKDKKDLNDAKLEWTKALYENNINTAAQIRQGIKNARRHNSDFIPSPGKFVFWCSPTPENRGWPPPHRAMKLCIAYRINMKLWKPRPVYTRPMIIELCHKVDWFYFDKCTVEKAEKHFNKIYQELALSDYVEPQETDAARLPTSETVEAGLSDKQKSEIREQGMQRIEELKNIFKR